MSHSLLAILQFSADLQHNSTFFRGKSNLIWVYLLYTKQPLVTFESLLFMYDCEELMAVLLH